MGHTVHEGSSSQFPDELTFQEVIVSFARVFLWLKKNFLPLSLVMLVFISFMVIWAYRQPPTYTANLSFMLNDDNNPQISSVGGVLGQLGLPIPTGKYNVDKLMEIAKSRSILEATLFKKTEIDGKIDFIANHFIDHYDLKNRWSKIDQEYSDFKFNNSNFRSFSEKENFALKSLYQLIVGSSANRKNALFSTDYGKTDYIMSFATKSLSERLSIDFTNNLYDQVSKYYVEKSIEKNKSVYSLIKNKRDSLSAAVQKITYGIASIKDKNIGTFRNTNNVQIANLEGHLIGLETAYKEVEKSLNHADVALKSNTPLIQLLDRPLAPLNPSKPSLIKYGLAGALIGLFCYLLIIMSFQIISLVKADSKSLKNL